MWTLYGLAEVGSLTGNIVRRWKSQWAGDDHNGDEAPDSDLVMRRMSALGVDADAFARAEPALLGNLNTLCGECEYPDRCRHDLRRDPTGVTWEDYCPNATVLNAVAELGWFCTTNTRR
jgi:uncharacterized protein DUF6455